MKNRLLFLVVLLAFGYESNGCDICGCTAGGNYLGILPQYQKHFFGFRYNYSSYKSKHPDEGSFGNDYFHTTELWGRFAINNRLHLYGILPFHFIKREEGDQKNRLNELGDVSICELFDL